MKIPTALWICTRAGILNRATPMRLAKLRACVYVLAAKAAVMTFSMTRLLRLGAAAGERGSLEMPDLRDLEQERDAVEAASRRLGIVNCLVKALALRMALARRGVATRLHMGVRRTDPRTAKHAAIIGHAWLSYHGGVLIGSAELDKQYTEFQHGH